MRGLTAKERRRQADFRPHLGEVPVQDTPDFVLVPKKGTMAACRQCPKPSILDRLAVVS